MPKVGIVCDSTCDLEPAWLAEHEVTMVPLKVLFGDETFLDWVGMAPEEFYERLAASPTLPKTSQPSPSDFATAYAALAEGGAEEIVSIHLTSALSGTYESARIASDGASVPVRLVDTRHVTQATALAVKAALAARDAGADAAGIEEAATRTAASTRMFFILDTLEYLVKGGRAGRAQGLAASLLDIKPVLTFEDGVIVPFKKAKGRKKAMAELASYVAELSAQKPQTLALFHACAPDRADELRAALDAAGARYELESVGLVGAVIGTYAGRGAVGLACHPVS